MTLFKDLKVDLNISRNQSESFSAIYRDTGGSGFLDDYVFVDFVNATFIPVLVLALVGLYYEAKYYQNLV